MSALDGLISEIRSEFRDVPVPQHLPQQAKSLEQLALDLPLMMEDVERWYLPQIMCDCLEQVQEGSLPRDSVEMVLCAFSPEGMLRERNTNTTERLLFERRVDFLNRFNSAQRKVICAWTEFMAVRPELSGWFRDFERIRKRFDDCA